MFLNDIEIKERFLIHDLYHRHNNKNNTTGATSVAGTDCPYGAPVFTPGFSCGSPFLIY
jgi:hypothetical protein